VRGGQKERKGTVSTRVLLLLVLLQSVGSASDAVRLRDEGDAAFERIEYEEARRAYESALRESPSDGQILWRLARVCVCMGEVAEEPQRGELFRKAEQYARFAVSAEPSSAEGHTWLAGSLGYIAYYSSTSRQVALVREILQETAAAIALDPRSDAAYSIRGSTYRALGNVGWVERQFAALFLGSLPDGGYAEGEAALKQAIAIAPGIMRHWYELGVLYLDWGKTEEARTALLEAERRAVRVAIDRPRLEKTRELLGSLREEE
jgi:tetratricopeptide (TPR) repeat protein